MCSAKAPLGSCDQLPGRVTREKYQRLIDLAVGANFNMLRIWGGGIYEDPCFYEFCDRAGIMIWHDFMSQAIILTITTGSATSPA